MLCPPCSFDTAWVSQPTEITQFISSQALKMIDELNKLEVNGRRPSFRSESPHRRVVFCSRLHDQHVSERRAVSREHRERCTGAHSGWLKSNSVSAAHLEAARGSVAVCRTAGIGASFSLLLARAKARRPNPRAAAQPWTWELIFIPFSGLCRFIRSSRLREAAEH